MKTLKRLLVLQFLFLFVIPITFGEIIITLPEKDMYNLGEKIVPSVSIKEDKDYDGYFTLHIFCGDNDMLSYWEHLEDKIKSGSRTQLSILDQYNRPLSMVGECKLKSSFEAIDGDIVDKEWSEYFLVTNKINITIDDLEAKPGEDVIISGEVRKYSGELLFKGEAGITFKGNEEIINVSKGKFEHTIHLENDIEAGNIQIRIIVTDKYGNYADKTLNLKVLPIPKRIENHFENAILMPGDNIKAKVILYDHSNKIIEGSKINVKIFDPDERLIAEKDVENQGYLEFKTKNTQKPGNYFLLSAFENIKQQDSFTIETVRKIEMTQDSNFVYIENIGNIEYNDEVTIVLESDKKKYLINKKISLKPAEKITIDLSKEVPQGTYDIILPEEIVSADETTSDDDVEQTNVIENVLIEDNRPTIKKTADSISLITGAVVRAAGYVASKPMLAGTILVLIILGTVIHYSWGFIKNTVKGKKEDDTENIFEDFKFDEDEDNKPGN